MTKAQIIQRLLDEKHITVEEAMTLMTQEPKPMTPTVPDWPNPYQPPFKVGDPDGTGTNPYQHPFKVGDPDWTYDPNRNPIRYTTTTFETREDNEV